MRLVESYAEHTDGDQPPRRIAQDERERAQEREARRKGVSGWMGAATRQKDGNWTIQRLFAFRAFC